MDGFFVSNFGGKTPFAAVNFIMPVLLILGGFRFVFGAGGSALVGMMLGQGQKEKANRVFSQLIYTCFALGVFIGILGIVFLRPIASLLGAQGDCWISVWGTGGSFFCRFHAKCFSSPSGPS